MLKWPPIMCQRDPLSSSKSNKIGSPIKIHNIISFGSKSRLIINYSNNFFTTLKFCLHQI